MEQFLNVTSSVLADWRELSVSKTDLSVFVNADWEGNLALSTLDCMFCCMRYRVMTRDNKSTWYNNTSLCKHVMT